LSIAKENPPKPSSSRPHRSCTLPNPKTASSHKIFTFVLLFFVFVLTILTPGKVPSALAHLLAFLLTGLPEGPLRVLAGQNVTFFLNFFLSPKTMALSTVAPLSLLF
jgi:hypothetical protein